MRSEGLFFGKRLNKALVKQYVDDGGNIKEFIERYDVKSLTGVKFQLVLDALRGAGVGDKDLHWLYA